MLSKETNLVVSQNEGVHFLIIQFISHLREFHWSLGKPHHSEAPERQNEQLGLHWLAKGPAGCWDGQGGTLPPVEYIYIIRLYIILNYIMIYYIVLY